MSFLDTLKKTAGAAAQVAAVTADTAVNKTKTMASIGRVKLAISSEEDKLKKAYTELGRLFYRDYEAQAEADMAEYLPWCGKAADAREQIQRLTEELEKLKEENKKPEKAPEAPAAAEAAEAPAQEVPEEDMSIFADLDEEEAAPEAPAASEAPAAPEAPATPEAPAAPEMPAPETPATEVAEAPEAPAASEAPTAPETPEDMSGIVGTFYLDTTGQDTEI